jgi:glycosyltransferase involved in cell wall biosynthesis
MAAPKLSVVIPIYNEETILRSAVEDLIAQLSTTAWTFEILLAENGSRDRTVAIAEELAAAYPQVKAHSLGAPNYGLALREGILRATGEYVVCDEIDLCDVDFHRRALAVLEQGDADLVVGSKVMKGAEDQRPLLRHAATLVINGMLRVLVGFRGTDTHGLKAFRRAALTDVVRSCVVDRDLFASEFVIRAERKVRVVEIPVHIAEKRPPSVKLLQRVPKVLRDIARLTYVIRFKAR